MITIIITITITIIINTNDKKKLIMNGNNKCSDGWTTETASGSSKKGPR